MKKRTFLSVIIPTYNEGENIGRFIKSLKKQTVKQKDTGIAQTEIIVSDASDDDKCINIARENGALTVKSEKGRGRQLLHGLKKASGNYFLFLHADVDLEEDFLKVLEDAINNDVDYGCFTLRMNSDRRIYRIGEFLSNRRSASGIVFGDQGIFFSKRHLEKFGTFPDIPLMEDYQYTLSLKKKGVLPQVLPSLITASVRRFENQGIIRTGFRMHIMRILFRMGVSPEKLRLIYKNGLIKSLTGFLIKTQKGDIKGKESE